MNIKTRLVAGSSALALAGSLIAFAAPAAHGAVLNVGSCQDLLALGKAKSSTINPATSEAYGITDQDNLDVTVSSKGVDPNTLKGTTLGTCTFNTGLSTPDSSKKPVVKGYSGTKQVLKWSTKLFSPESDCNVSDTGDNTEWPLNGALKIAFADLNTSGKSQQLAAQIVVDGFTDPDNNPSTPSDVVTFHGIVTKGVAAGATVNGETEFDPTVKDKAQTTSTPYFGYQYDLGGAGGCADTTPSNANILLFNNGSVGGMSQLLGLPVAGISFSIGTP